MELRKEKESVVMFSKTDSSYKFGHFLAND